SKKLMIVKQTRTSRSYWPTRSNSSPSGRGNSSERVALARDAVEVGARVAAERAEVEVAVVLDPAHRDLRRLAIALLRGGVFGPAPEDVVELLLQQALDEREVVRRRRPLRRRRAMPDALRDLSHRHAARREILHERRMHARLALEAVDALGTAAVEPALDVLDDHARVAPRALERDGARRHLDPHGIVVGLRHLGRGPETGRDQLLERIGRRLHVEDVSDPAAEESLRGLPLLVLANRVGGHAVDLGIIARQRG